METMTAVVAKGWREHEGTLVRAFNFRDFDDAWTFVGSIAERAADFGRRPDIHLQTNPTSHLRLVVRNVNHAGLTEAELRLAARVEAAIDEHHQSGRVPLLAFEDGVLRARV